MANDLKQGQTDSTDFLILCLSVLCFAPNLAPPNFPLFNHFAAPWGVAPLVSDKICRLALLPVQLFAALGPARNAVTMLHTRSARGTTLNTLFSLAHYTLPRGALTCYSPRVSRGYRPAGRDAAEMLLSLVHTCHHTDTGGV